MAAKKAYEERLLKELEKVCYPSGSSSLLTTRLILQIMRARTVSKVLPMRLSSNSILFIIVAVGI